MPNAIKYSTSNVSNTIRKGNMSIGVNSVGYGPTVNTGFYNGYYVPNNGYVIYINKSSNGPSIYAPSNDTELINIVKGLGGSNINTVVDALSWVNGQSDMIVVNKQYTNMVTDGLVLCFDASLVSSYPKGNNIWYDVSGNNSNGTLINSPSYNDTSKSIVLDGGDDFIDTGKTAAQFGFYNGSYTMEAWVYPTDLANDRTMFGTDQTSYATGLHLVFRNGVIYQGHYGTDFGAGSVSANIWYQIVYTYNASNNVCEIFKNGVSQGSGNISPFVGTTNILLSRWAGGGYFQGNGSSYRIYNRVLTPAEILQNYYKNNLITTNITHRWDFSNVVSYEGSGTSVKNLSGTVNGILWNGPTYKNQFGGYMTFDGTNDYMELIGGNYTITLGDGNSPWTVNAWVRTTTTANALGEGSVLSNSSGGPVYSMMGVNDGKIVYWTYPSNINNWKSFKGNKTVTDGNWHLLTWVQNTGYSMDMYVDGVLDVTVSPTNTGNNNPIDIIGGSWVATFNGDIGEVQINTKAFTSSEVTQQYTSTQLRYEVPLGPVTNGLILHWDPANINSYPGSGNIIYDLTGNGYHGTLYNGVGFSRVNGGVLTFDGVDDYVRGGPNMASSNYTLMGASRYVSIGGRVIAATNNYLLGHWAAYTNDHYAEGWVYYNPSISDTNWSIYAGSGNIGSDSYQFYMNNVLLASNNGGSQGPNEIVLGCYGPGYEFSNAQVGPILLYDRVLTSVELTQNYNYLKGRFGL